MLDILRDFYAPDGAERVGFILTDGSVVEVENVAADPIEGFDVCAEDLITFGERAVASWHTHPGAKANLSASDYDGFLSWPTLEHYVIGNDCIRKFAVVDGQVLHTGAYDEAADSLPREPSGSLS